MAVLQSDSTLKPSAMYLAYGNICNICRLIISRTPLPLAPPFDRLWLHINKVIDSFHLRNHIQQCQIDYSPQPLKDRHPNFNTQAGEQTFVWLGRFKHNVCAMTKTHHLFYLHRMIRRRNSYTAKCYLHGKKTYSAKGKKIVRHAESIAIHL